MSVGEQVGLGSLAGDARTGTAKDLLEVLRRHYGADDPIRPRGIFAAEIQAPGSSTRRADLIWAPTTIAGGRGKLVGHEIKVTRSDVLAELKDHTKAEPWSVHCDQWWLVITSPYLIEGLDIPDAWGIMAPPTGRRTRSMTIVRPAPSRDVRSAEGWATVATWLYYQQSRKVAELEQSLDRHKRQVSYLERELDKLRETSGYSADPHALKAGELLRLVEERARGRQVWSSADTSSVADAVVDLAAVQVGALDLARALQRIVGELEEPSAILTRHLAQANDQLAQAAALPGRADQGHRDVR